MAKLLQTRRTKGLALALACMIAIVGVAASCASFSVSLMAAAHACCHTEQADLSCLTLCAASESDAVLTLAEETGPVLALIGDTQAPADLSAARSDHPRSFVSSSDASPPLYVLYSAFLI